MSSVSSSLRKAVVAIGPREDMLCFAAAGADVRPAAAGEETAEQLKRAMTEPGVTLVLAPEQCVEECADVVRALRQESHVVLLALPSRAGSTGFTLREMGKLIEKAVGVDLLKD